MSVDPPRLSLIANPAAGGGRAARLLPRVRDALTARGCRDVTITTSPGEERALARRAAAAGVETIVALGGDGTWSNVARGILDADSDTRLALLAGGTGNDFARNVNAPADDIAVTLDLALGAKERRVDVGFANEVAFVNCCGVGFDVAVIQALEHSDLGGRSLGKSAYLVTAARLFWSYHGISAAIGDSTLQPYLVIALGNGAYFGGGMQLAPGARNDDGLLDLIAVRDGTPMKRLRTLLAAAGGRHLGRDGVEHRRAGAFELQFVAPPLFEVDGELMQADRPCLTVRCDQRRLRICAP